MSVCEALCKEGVWEVAEVTTPRACTPAVDPAITFAVRAYRLLQ